MFDFLKRSLTSRSQRKARSRVEAIENPPVERVAPPVPGSQRELGEHALRDGNYPLAVFHLQAAVGETELRATPTPVKVRVRLNLATAFIQQATEPNPLRNELLQSAETQARAAISIAAAASDQGGYLDCLETLGVIYGERRDFAALEVLQRQAIQVSDTLPQRDPLRCAKQHYRLAIAIHMRGSHSETVDTLDKTLELFAEAYPEDTLDFATALFEIGSLLRNAGEHQRALKCLERAAKIQVPLLGQTSDEALATRQVIAGCVDDAGDVTRAAELYEQCLMIKLRQIGVKYLEEAALMQYGLANMHANWGNLPRARELLSDCIGVFRRDKGPRLAVTHEMLAQVEERSGRWTIALKELENAGTVWETCNPPRYTELVHNMRYRADLLDQMQKQFLADQLRERADEVERTHLRPPSNAAEATAAQGTS